MSSTTGGPAIRLVSFLRIKLGIFSAKGQLFILAGLTGVRVCRGAWLLTSNPEIQLQSGNKM